MKTKCSIFLKSACTLFLFLILSVLYTPLLPAENNFASKDLNTNSAPLVGRYEVREEYTTNTSAPYYGVIATPEGIFEIQSSDAKELFKIPSNTLVQVSFSKNNSLLSDAHQINATVLNASNEVFKNFKGQPVFITPHHSLETPQDVFSSSKKNHRVLVVLFQTATHTPAAGSVRDAQNFYFGPQKNSFKSQIERISRGNLKIEGQVYAYLQGPLCWTRTAAYVARELALQKILRTSPQLQFDTMFFVLPDHPSCNTPNFATLGPVTLAYENGERTFSSAWLNWNNGPNPTTDTNIALHEFGHNLGLLHASRRHCATSFFSNLEQCQNEEYWDPQDIMGSGYFTWGAGFSATHSQKLGWLQKKEIITVETSGEYTLYDFYSESQETPKLLKIPIAVAPKSFGYGPKFIYVEYVGSLEYPNAVFVRTLSAYGNELSLSQVNAQGWTSWLENPRQEIALPEAGIRISLIRRDISKATLQVDLVSPPTSPWPVTIASVYSGDAYRGACEDIIVNVKTINSSYANSIYFQITDLITQKTAPSLSWSQSILADNTLQFRIQSAEINPASPQRIEVISDLQEATTSLILPARTCANFKPIKFQITQRAPDPQNCQNLIIAGQLSGAQTEDLLKLQMYRWDLGSNTEVSTPVDKTGYFRFYLANTNPNYSYNYTLQHIRKNVFTSGTTLIQPCTAVPRNDLEFLDDTALTPLSCSTLGIQVKSSQAPNLTSQSLTLGAVLMQARVAEEEPHQCWAAVGPMSALSSCIVTNIAPGTTQIITAQQGPSRTWGFVQMPNCK